MSKQLNTAADNKLMRESTGRVVAVCMVKGCKFCADLRRELGRILKEEK